ncbi:MAG: hypothetical protein ACYC2H_01160 [Thermoplasmatota archaeon]
MILAGILLALAHGVVAVPTLHFSTPAQAGPSLNASGASWALILSASRMESSWTIEDASDLVRQEHERFVIGEHKIPYARHPGQSTDVDGTDQTPLPERFNMTAQTLGMTSFYIEGEDLELTLNGVTAVLDIPGGSCLESIVAQEDFSDQATRSDKLCPGSWPAVIARSTSGAAMTFAVDGAGVHRIQWHNMETTCSDGEACPPGGSHQNETVWLSSTDYVRTRHNVFEEAVGPASANVTGWGEAQLIVLGGTRFDLDVDGWIRLPLASSNAGCPTCLAPADQTFSATGNITLSNLQVASGDRLQGDLSGDLISARFDEVAVDPLALSGKAAFAAVAAVGGLVVMVKYLLWPLFTRHKEDDLLKNDRRRQIYEFVVKNPGVHFREALRATGIPAGSGQYHINRLVAAGLLIQRRQRSSLRLFENHKRFHETWQDWVALRDPRLRQLHDWLVQHPDSKQKDILDAFRSAHGWSLTTTQRRLERLVRDGVAKAHTRGRGKFYSATTASATLMPSVPPIRALATA